MTSIEPVPVKLYSYTASGWEISHDPEAEPSRQWRIRHQEWGTRFHSSHEAASMDALTTGIKHLQERLAKSGLSPSSGR